MSTMSSISKWLRESWRPMAAYVYLAICLCDFAGMPLYHTFIMNKTMNADNVALALKFKDSAAQIEALKIVRQTAVWEPITLQQSGLFHMAFGAILGVAAWTRGQEKVEAVKHGPVPAASAPPFPPRPQRPIENPHAIEGGPR